MCLWLLVGLWLWWLSTFELLPASGSQFCHLSCSCRRGGCCCSVWFQFGIFFWGWGRGCLYLSSRCWDGLSGFMRAGLPVGCPAAFVCCCHHRAPIHLQRLVVSKPLSIIFSDPVLPTLVRPRGCFRLLLFAFSSLTLDFSLDACHWVGGRRWLMRL